MNPRDRQFGEAYEQLSPVLEKLFFKVIRRYPGDRVIRPEDLVQITAEQALVNSRLPQYADYHVNALIWLKANNVISTYKRAMRRQPWQVDAEMESACHLPDPYKFLLLREVFNYLFNHTDQMTWQICVLLREGWTYAQISLLLGISEGSIKMRIHRLKKELQLHNLRPD